MCLEDEASIPPLIFDENVDALTVFEISLATISSKTTLVEGLLKVTTFFGYPFSIPLTPAPTLPRCPVLPSSSSVDHISTGESM